MEPTADLINRRQALARVVYLMGGAISAPTVAAVLAGCAARATSTDGASWVPRTLSPEQSRMVLVMGEYILPETDTPGARSARVDQFIDALLSDYLPEPARRQFLAGLERADARARRAFGKPFLELPSARQLELVEALNRAAFRGRGAEAKVPPEQAAHPGNPVLQENDVQTGNERALPKVDTQWDSADTGRESFFRTLKELVLVGFYTSEVGATEELGVNPMGVWRSDVPYSEIGHAWA